MRLEGIAWARLDEPQRTLAAYRAALQASPEAPEVVNEVAWMLATDAAVGDPAEAVQLAERACRLSDRRQAGCLDTLAAAYAAAGRSEEAVAALEEALQLLPPDADAAKRAALARRKELYAAGESYRQE